MIAEHLRIQAGVNSTSRILVLANGTSGSAAGKRAQILASAMASGRVEILYRAPNKRRSCVEFIIKGLFRRPTIVYVVDCAYAGVIAAIILKLVYKAQFILDTGDACAALANSSGRYNRFQVAMIWVIEQLGLRASTAVAVRGRTHLRLLRRWFPKKKVVWLPDMAEDVSTDCIGRRNQGTQPLVVAIVGSLVYSQRHKCCYGWELVEAAQYTKGIGARYIIIGDGDGLVGLKQRARELGVEDSIEFRGALYGKKLQEALLESDICISTQSSDLVGRVRTTGKLPLYLAYGRYVIASRVGEASRVLKAVGSTVPIRGVRDVRYPERLAAEILMLHRNRKLLEVAQGGPAVVRCLFSEVVVGRRARELIQQLEGTQ